jgi:Polyketide cyclase / dehydrase and lipid transport
MLKIVSIIIVVAVAAVLLFAATRPDTFQVQRSASINAAPNKIFPHLNDFTKWGAWSPWEKKDPGMKRNFGNITAGKGATYAWDGNQDVGQGSMEIIESVAPSRLSIRLSFMKPFEARNTVEFALEPKGASTQVTWTMHGPVPYISKIIHLFMDIDRMVGADFESGLGNLKVIAEK